MARRCYDLPSLTSLAAFEAAARHSSFTLAAEELNVTPGAVSRQVKALEEEIGQSLFERKPRGLGLTDAGNELAAVLSRSFQEMARTLTGLRQSGKPESVTVATTTAFAALWLMPRLGAFWREHQAITINHLISDDPHDPRLGRADLRLGYGFGPQPDEVGIRLFSDRLYPVAGPRFAAALGKVGLDVLAGLPLIANDSGNRDWIDWGEWLDLAGYMPRKLNLRRFNNYIIALQAAEDDQGVVLGWHRLVAPLIEAGRLVRMTTTELASPLAYHASWSADRPLGAAAEALKAWLVGLAQEEV